MSASNDEPKLEETFEVNPGSSPGRYVIGPPPSLLRDRSLMFVVIGAAIAILMNLGYTTWAVQESNHRWCTTIGTLNAADAHSPPPTTSFGRHLVADFENLYKSLGCG